MSETATLSTQEKHDLLHLAREALCIAVAGGKLPPLDLEGLSPRLAAPGASFVTLMKGDQLRGCIGGLEARIALAEDVRQHALAAARYDYRFPPVKQEELDQIVIEISILTIPQPLNYRDPTQIPQLLRPDIDGVILTDGIHRATFLPQVWKKVQSPTQFLESLCHKAGLRKDAWQTGQLDILTYQVHHFSEDCLSEAD